MKFIGLVMLTVVLFLSYLAIEQFDVAMRELDAKALFGRSQQKDIAPQEAETLLLQAIEKLRYSDLFAKQMVVNPAVLAAYYRVLAEQQDDAEKAQTSYQHAKLYFRNALTLKPTKSTNWTSLALVKWALAEVDDDYFQSIANADRFGQHDPQTHIKLVQLGALMIEQNLNFTPDIQAIILHHLIYGLLHPKSDLSIQYGIIRSDKVRARFCFWLSQTNELKTKLECD